MSEEKNHMVCIGKSKPEYQWHRILRTKYCIQNIDSFYSVSCPKRVWGTFDESAGPESKPGLSTTSRSGGQQCLKLQSWLSLRSLVSSPQTHVPTYSVLGNIVTGPKGFHCAL
ncbi:uncharacterized protein LOC144822660 [Lissotriton helveticus]